MVGWVDGAAAVRKSEPSDIFHLHTYSVSLNLHKKIDAIANFYCDESLLYAFIYKSMIYNELIKTRIFLIKERRNLKGNADYFLVGSFEIIPMFSPTRMVVLRVSSPTSNSAPKVNLFSG